VHLRREKPLPFEMLDTGPPLTDLRIGVLERKLGIVLPEGYRSFLLRHNGGRPKPDFFPIQACENNPFGSIHYFNGIGWPANSSNIEWNYKTFRGRMPREFLPIAGDGSGNEICLSLKGTNKGAVYFWDHDEEHSPPTYENVYLVAETFEGFLDSFYFEDLSEEIAKSLGKAFQQHH
jgi:cell wall assembly regulator SMI1